MYELFLDFRCYDVMLFYKMYIVFSVLVRNSPCQIYVEYDKIKSYQLIIIIDITHFYNVCGKSHLKLMVASCYLEISKFCKRLVENC